jgi:hypothetical protein
MYGTTAPTAVWLLPLLLILSICVLVLTIAVVWLALDVHATLHRLNTVLPEAQRSLRHLRRLLARADRAAQQIDDVVQGVCGAVSGALTRVRRRYFGSVSNGAGADPRRHARGVRRT